MENYTHENTKEKSVRLKFYNVVIYPESSQSPNYYAELLEKVKDRKIRVNTYSDKNTRIRTMYVHDGLIYGALINYTKLNGEGWFNEESEEIEEVDINPNLNPNSKEWDYFFLPEAHRLAIFDSSNVSASQIAKFFESALNQVTKDVEEVKVSIISTENIIDEIFEADNLTNLKINVSYTNNDNNDDWEAIIDEQMKENEVSETNLVAKGTKKKPIKLKEDSFLGGMLKLSRENGSAEAVIISENKRRVIKTSEYPLVEEIRYVENDSLLDKIKSFILRISRRDGA